jgi:hypothetical protein
VENQAETIGLHINVEKGIKITIANNLEAIAAAETTFKSMLAPDQWIHLAFNMGTLAEGKRVTKTLTAFVNCQKVLPFLQNCLKSCKLNKDLSIF